MPLWKNVLAVSLLVSVPLVSQERMQPVGLSEFFQGMKGTFVLLDGQTGQYRAHDTTRVKTRFIPASTFKIPHTLIILETGLAADEEFTLRWNPERDPAQDWWPNSWRGDQTLRSAFRNSVVWFYQETARRIGEHQMRAYLRAFDYGNQDLGGGIDRFWLDGELRISPVEQISFLQRVFRADIRLSRTTRNMLRDIMLLEQDGDFRLYGKT